jgi:predicted GH43/DUF377 family glycosyl hydrolase
MLKRLFDKCIVSPDDVTPSQEDLEVVGTFNPGVIRFGDMTYFLIRVAEKPKEKKEGQIPLPRAENRNIVIDWQKIDAVTVLDERAVLSKPEGFLCPTTISHLRLAKSRNGIEIDSIAETPTIFSEGLYEEFGVEDARITHIGDRFYITYVAVSRHGIVTALASTKDFVQFKKHGIIFPTENKDVVIFPEKVGDNYVAFHRPLSANPFGPPEMWMAYSPDLTHWGQHHCLIEGGSDWDSMKVGAGAPPIRTKEGWLEIYHGSYKANETDNVGVYCAGAALFDLDNPEKLIDKSKHPILTPETEYERSGFLASIVFPTGIVVEGDELLIYYGAADTYTAVTKLSLQDILDAIKA